MATFKINKPEPVPVTVSLELSIDEVQVLSALLGSGMLASSSYNVRIAL